MGTISDGQNYLSRARINRTVVTLNDANSFVASVNLNGKVSKIIIDATGSLYSSGTGKIGILKAQMDLSDGTGTPYNVFDQIGLVNYSGGVTTNQVTYLEVSPGSNQGTANAQNSLHFSVTAPAVTTGPGAITEPAAWNGHLCGTTTFTALAGGAAVFDLSAEIKLIILTE
tara:strand:+ start:40 stop:552 length:513 start_codon:yes stop_codon:yes gene_type:complete